MAYEILMPQLGLTMEEGTVSAWLKHEGDPVKAGEAVAEITTDKLTNEVQSEHDGILLKIVAEEGEDIPVKGILAYVGQPGEAVGNASRAEAEAEPAAENNKPAETATAEATAQNISAAADGVRIRISPLARKTAAKLGITELADIKGSGTSGRIVRADIIAAAEAAKTVSASASTNAAEAKTASAVAGGSIELMEGDTIAKMTGMRKVVAERMFASHNEIPPVTQNTKVDVTELVKFRKLLIEKTGRKYSVNDLIVKATAKVLQSHPEILVSYDDGQMIQRAHINIGMAVALDAGLIVPVIRDADKLGLDALADQAKDLATRAKTNKLLPDEYKGSTFSISNLGMFGIETFTPIINQPDAGILGVRAIEDELVMDDEGNISKHQVMRLSFTYDHRLIDGATAAKFIMDIRDLLQTPMRIVL